MIKILTEVYMKNHKSGDRSHSLPIEERLLMALEYIREYKTYGHISASYGVRKKCCIIKI